MKPQTRNYLIFLLVVLALTLASVLCEWDRGDVRTPRPTQPPTFTVLREYGPTPYRFAPMATLTPRR